MARLIAGTVTHDEVFDDDGHGALVLDGYRALPPFAFVAITGPNRAMAAGLGWPRGTARRDDGAIHRLRDPPDRHVRPHRDPQLLTVHRHEIAQTTEAPPAWAGPARPIRCPCPR